MEMQRCKDKLQLNSEVILPETGRNLREIKDEWVEMLDGEMQE